jgi:hypothetical protein
MRTFLRRHTGTPPGAGVPDFLEASFGSSPAILARVTGAVRERARWVEPARVDGRDNAPRLDDISDDIVSWSSVAARCDVAYPVRID